MLQLKYFRSEFKQFQLTERSVVEYHKRDAEHSKYFCLKTTDGKKILVEHFSLRDPDNYNIHGLAEEADIIISCYPKYCGELYNLKNMLFPEHRLRVGTKVEGNTLICQTLAVGTIKEFLKDPIRKDDFFTWAKDLAEKFIENGYKPLI